MDDGPRVTAGGAFASAKDVQESVEAVEEGGLGRLVDVLDLEGVLDQVIVLLLARAPHCVQEVVPLADQADGLVSVGIESGGGILHEGLGPEFDTEGLCGLILSVDGLVLQNRDRVCVERVWHREVGEVEDCCREVRVSCDGVGFLALGDSWAADDEGDVGIFLVGGLLAGIHAVGTQVVAVIGRVDNVGVVKLVVVFEAFDDPLDQLVGRLEGLQARAVFGVQGRDLRLGQTREGADPGGLIVMLGVEVWMTRDLGVFKQVLVSFRRDRRREHGAGSIEPYLVMRSRR